MFCPEGYVTLDGTCVALRVLSDKWWEEVGEALQEKDYNERVLSGEKHITMGPFPNPVFRAETAKAAYMKWLAYRFTTRNWERFFICSPDGQTLRIGPVFLGLYDRALEDPFPNRVDYQDVIATDFSVFLHIRYPHGLISPSDDEDYIAMHGLENEIEAVKPFTGWAVCWKPKVFENWRQEVQEILLEPSEGPELPPEMMSRRGRPKKGDGIVERAVQREFQRRLSAGELVLDQRESIYAAADEWVQHIFGQAMPRSSAQRILAEILKESPAQK